ncbi:Fc.00g041240.m01.CDS01 [Cosmosporella sp. VM-42]
MSASFIDLLSEHGDVEYLTERVLNSPRRSRSGSSCTIGYSPGPEEAVADPFNGEVIDLTNDAHDFSRYGLLDDNEYALERLQIGGFFVKPGMFLEINDFFLGKYRIEFILVRVIAQSETTRPKIRGVPYARTRNLLGKLPKKANEVCMILYFNSNEPRANSEGLVDKLEVHFTPAGNQAKPQEEAIIRINADHLPDARYRVSEDILCNQWRGGRVKGGSWVPSNQLASVDLDSDPANPPPTSCRLPGQQYTMFDSFSGAGGVSRGANMSGFKVRYAVDKAEEVWRTYKTNFRDTELFKMSLDEFVANLGHRHIRVDVLHFSPPCQFFSPAHTHASVHDDANIFALFGCSQLIHLTRPRIITVEQTFGITHEHHVGYLRALISDFTQFGYSVRWKVVRLCTWGAAQDRKRLIIIAAAPGEKLPPFPQSTHAEGGAGGLNPWHTIRRAIQSVRTGDDLHDPGQAIHYNPRRPSYDPNRLAGTITTGGGQSHPDGTREFTLRELASLQGFPKRHRFIGNKTSIKRQIGNAFPPNTVRVLYSHIEQWLLTQDGMRRHQPAMQNVVNLDYVPVGFVIDDDSDGSNHAVDDSEREQSPEMGEDVMEIINDFSNQRGSGETVAEPMVID